MSKKRKFLVFISIFSLIISACGGGDSSSTPVIEDTTTTSSTTTTLAPTPVEVVDEAALVIPPILLKPLIGATGILVEGGEDWEIISAIVPLDMGVKIRTADNGTAQMTFEDGSTLLMGGNSVINVRSFDYDEEAGSRILTVDVISGSIAYDIFSEGLTASMAKIVTPTAELSVHGTEGVFEYDVSTFSAKSTVLEGGEKTDDAVFSELLPDENGNPVLVAVSQTAGTELGSATTGGSGWVEEEASTVALIVDDFVSNMEGDCSYTCKAETQAGLAEGSEDLTAETAADAVFTENDKDRMDLTTTLLVAAGAPEEVTDSVEVLAEAVAEVAVPTEQVQEFIDETFVAPTDELEDGEIQPTEFFDNFGDAAAVHENEEFDDLGFDHEDHGDFRAQHGMMQFISADTNAVNELAETGDVASAMALAASNMFVNAGEEEFAEGTFCYSNPDDPECQAGAPPPEFLAQAFKGNHFVEDMVQDMGFEYSFTENDFKPEYCVDEPWLPECSDGPEYHGDYFEEDGEFCQANPEECEGGFDHHDIYGGPDEDSFCYSNPDAEECQGGNAAAVYQFFHVYDDEVLGDDWEPVDCEEYPEDSMCTGEGDFFHQHVGDASAIALDRGDMFDIFGGPEELSGPPDEYCDQNPDVYECSDEYKASDVYSTGEYVPPVYCDQTPDAPECSDDFGSHEDGYDGPLSGDFLSQYASPEKEISGPSFCNEYPDHPECGREYHDHSDEDHGPSGAFLSNVFSDNSEVDLAQQAKYNNTIDAADDLAESRYGEHGEYYVLDCSQEDNYDNPDCIEDGSPHGGGLYSGGEGEVSEYEDIGEGNADEICETDPNNPICYEAQEGEDAWDHHEGEGDHGEDGFSWADEDNANQYQESQSQHEEFEEDFCEENPSDPSCDHGEGDYGIDCSEPENQDTPECTGGVPPPGPGGGPGDDPGEGDYGIDCSEPENQDTPECTGGSPGGDPNACPPNCAPLEGEDGLGEGDNDGSPGGGQDYCAQNPDECDDPNQQYTCPPNCGGNEGGNPGGNEGGNPGGNEGGNQEP